MKKFQYIKTEDNTTHDIILNGLTLLQWVKINFCGWGFYKVEKTGTNKYNIYNKFDNSLVYKIF